MQSWHKHVRRIRDYQHLRLTTIMHLSNLAMLVIPEISKDHSRFEFFTDIQEALVKHGKQGALYKILFDINIPQCCKTGVPLFIHVPRCAGVSVSLALYGKQRDHHTAKYFKTIDPDFYSSVDSFAILREPVTRTLSAFSFVLNQGGKDMPLSRYWSERTRHIRMLDHYLDFLEENSGELDKLDFVMRPQSSFVCDDDGRLIVDYIFCLENDMGRLNQYLRGFQVPDISMANANKGETASATADQIERIRTLYKHDIALYSSARSTTVAIP